MTMDPQILTPPQYDSFLSEEAIDASRLELMVVRAEQKVLGRYREVGTHGEHLILDEHYGREIRLEGYVEDDNDDPDLDQMDDELLFALRDSIARIVEFWVEKPDEHIARQVQGDRTVEFRDKDLDSSVYAPLRPFDERHTWH